MGPVRPQVLGGPDTVKRYRAGDLCSGLGGWSDGLAAEGFDVQGIEIEEKVAKLYKHPVTVADVRTIDPHEWRGLDLIVASPPCRDFTKMAGFKHWREPANPIRGLELVKFCLHFIQEARPRYWLLENVPGLVRHLDEKPRTTAYLTPTMRRAFWGNFPPFLIPRAIGGQDITDVGGPLRAWIRAKIPLPVARSLGRAVREALDAKPLYGLDGLDAFPQGVPPIPAIN